MGLKKELLSHLSFDNIYKKVWTHFGQISDPRASNCTYSLSDMLKSGFAMFSLKEPSLLSFQNHSHDFVCNMNEIFKINAVPGDTSLRETLDLIEPGEIKRIFKKVFTYLKRNAVFDTYRYLDDYLLISIDGVEHFRSKKIHCTQCLETHHSHGEVSYHHAMLCAVVVNPDCKEVFPIGCEEIIKQDGSKKNDCEINASKRLLSNLIRDYKREKFLIIEDALYSVQPHIEQLTKANYSYLLGVKPGRHKSLFSQMKGRIERNQIDKLFDNAGVISNRYYWMNNVPINGQKNAIRVNLLHYERVEENDLKKQFTWVTNINIKKNNVNQLMHAGRARWKIENETFNTLKNQGYHMQHNFGHGKKYLTTILTTIMLLAFLVDQIQQRGCKLFSKLLSQLKTRNKLWEYQRSCFFILPFKSMFDLHLKIASLFQVQLE